MNNFINEREIKINYNIDQMIKFIYSEKSPLMPIIKTIQKEFNLYFCEKNELIEKLKESIENNLYTNSNFNTDKCTEFADVIIKECFNKNTE